MKFYICKKCGRLMDEILGGAPPVCCGEPMTQLNPNTTDGAKEKHVPAIVRKDGRLDVNIGSADHPMLEEHYIGFIAVEQGGAFQRVTLKPGDKPHAAFVIADGPVTVYEWCNLHGLWMAEG